MPLGIEARRIVGVLVAPDLDVVLGPVAGHVEEAHHPHINEGVDIHLGGYVVVVLLVGQIVLTHILHHLVEGILIPLDTRGDHEVGVGIGMDLAVVALDDRDVILIHAVMALHVLGRVTLTEVVDTPELPVDEDQGGGSGHMIHIQSCGSGLHIGVADKGGGAVVARVTDHEAGEGGDGLAPGVLGGTAEDVVVEVGLQTAVLIHGTLEVDAQGLHAPARGAVSADGHFHAGVAYALTLGVEDLHDGHAPAALARDGACEHEVVVEALGADDLVLGHGEGHDGDTVLLQIVGDEVGVGEDVGGLTAVGGVGLDDVGTHLGRDGGRGPGAGQGAPAHGRGVAEHDARGVLLAVAVGGQGGIRSVGGVVDGVAALGGQVEDEGLIVDARVLGEQHLVELGGGHLVDGAVGCTGAEVAELGGGRAGEVDGMVAAVLLHGGADRYLVTGEVVEGVDRGVVLHGGYEDRNRVVKDGDVLVAADAPARGGQQEADLLVVQVDIPLGVAMLDLHDGVIGIKIAGRVGTHQVVAPRGDDGTLGENELIEGIVSVALVVERGPRQGDILARLVVELDVAVGDEGLGTLLARTVDRVDQDTLVGGGVTGVQVGIVGRGLLLGIGLGGVGLGIVPGDLQHGRLTRGLGGGVHARIVLGADGVGVGVRGLGRAVGGILGGLARHGVAVGIGLGGGIHGHRGILGGIGASGLIVTGGKHRHRKSHHQKDGQQPETGSVLLQKLHKRYLRFPKCVAVYLKKGEDVTQKRPQNRL